MAHAGIEGAATSQQQKKVVILGGGFGGLAAAKDLAQIADLRLCLIDRKNHHLFQPLLYQVATAGLTPAEIASPIRGFFSKKKFPHCEVHLAEATALDLQAKMVTTTAGVFTYDYLIVACGAHHSYFGNEHWEEYAPGLKSLEQATEIRRRVLTAFERAESETDAQKQRAYLTFVVIGGGPTGVELAGALGELSRFTLTKDFHRVDPASTRIMLIEAGERILPNFSPELASKTMRSLEALGVQTWTSKRVVDVSSEGVRINGEFIEAKTILWAAGVKPSPLNRFFASECDRQGRIIVQDDLSLKDHPEVFVIGDQAHVRQGDKILPGLAPVAMQEGRHAATNIRADLLARPRKPFIYKDKGQLTVIGRKTAALEIGRLQMHGFSAWLIWVFVHIYYLIGFKNRLFVLFEWIWHYLTYRRGARLITNAQWKSYQSPEVKTMSATKPNSMSTSHKPAVD